MAKKSKTETTPATAAGRVIKAFGGARRVAEILEIRPEAVYRWGYPKEKRGSDGTIPSEWHKPILNAAKKRGIRIKPADLVNC